MPAPVPQRTAASGPARETVVPHPLMSPEGQFARLRSLDGGPTREPAFARGAARPRASEPIRWPAPAVRAPAPRSEEQIADEIKDTIAHLEEALALGDRKNTGRYARRLKAQCKDHRESLSSDERRAIKALLRRARTS